jgi:glutamate synthase domain-containing protein 2
VQIVVSGWSRYYSFRSMKNLPEVIRRAHISLIEDSVRDQVTIVASGGIAEASHVPKAIILGADAVAIDRSLMVAMEFTLCGECNRGSTCPTKLQEIDPHWGKQRMSNMIASWHNQLLEILGAMGLREVSRLRGETGRAIFFNDLEKELIDDLKKAKTLGQVYK